MSVERYGPGDQGTKRQVLPGTTEAGTSKRIHPGTKVQG